MNLLNFNSEQTLAIVMFIGGTTALVSLSIYYGSIFKKAVEKDAGATAKEAGITFVSGHFLAFFVLPFAILVAAVLGVVGKLDAGVSAIIGMVIGYIVQKVVIR